MKWRTKIGLMALLGLGLLFVLTFFKLSRELRIDWS